MQRNEIDSLWPEECFSVVQGEEIMKTKLLVGLLFAGSALFAETHVSIGVGLGGYGYAPPPVVAYAPPPVVAYAQPYPGPGYTWVDGYWYQEDRRRAWHAGYWAPPAYGRSYRVGPRYYGDRYNGHRSGYRNGYYGNGDRYDGNRNGDNRNGYGYNNGYNRR